MVFENKSIFQGAAFFQLSQIKPKRLEGSGDSFQNCVAVVVILSSFSAVGSALLVPKNKIKSPFICVKKK
jgi:hypothetical protein